MTTAKKQATTVQGAKRVAKATPAKQVVTPVSSKPQPQGIGNSNIVSVKVPQVVQDYLISDKLQADTHPATNQYRFILMGKEDAHVSWEVEPSADVLPRLHKFLVANLNHRLEAIYTKKHMRLFSKSEAIQVYFTAKGKMLNAGAIGAKVGIKLTGGKNQFVPDEETGITPFKSKLDDIVDIGLTLIDNTDYSS